MAVMDMVFDASSIITLSTTCLFNVLKSLKNSFSGDFVISDSVERECVIRPLEIRRFELNAFRVKKGIDDGWIKVKTIDVETKKLAEEITFLANNSFFADNKPLNLMHLGEVESLALMNSLNTNLLTIDERTTRMVFEEPNALRRRLQEKYKTTVSLDNKNLKKLNEIVKEIKVFRSTELIALAFEKNLFDSELVHNKESLEAALFALKYNGCSVTADEILDFVSKVK
ncbi:MAG: hypothetical protein ABH821_04650 [archaeon]